MSLLDKFGDGTQLKIEHDTKYGLVCITHPGHRSAAPELNVDATTLNISTEDFVTMLKWYVYQKEKEENYYAIKWSEFNETQTEYLSLKGDLGDEFCFSARQDHVNVFLDDKIKLASSRAELGQTTSDGLQKQAKPQR